MTTIDYTIMHGLHNSFVMIEDLRNTLSDDLITSQIETLCNFGSPATDGVVLIRLSEMANFKMSIWNADGSVPEMCGNAVRCIGRYVLEKGLFTSPEIRLETGAGVRSIDILSQENDWYLRVGMGLPNFDVDAIPMNATQKDNTIEIQVPGFTGQLTGVSMGNPHGVIFVDEIPDVATIGPLIEQHDVFPEGANIEFVKIKSPQVCEVVVWERGAGLTQACGTGACAVVAVGSQKGLLDPQACEVHLPGGELLIRWPDPADEMFMIGPATFVSTGSVDL